MIELINEQIEFSYKGKTYNVDLPSYARVKEYRNDMDKAGIDSDKIEECIFSFLESLGFPRSVSKELQHKNILKILNSVLGDEKK